VKRLLITALVVAGCGGPIPPPALETLLATPTPTGLETEAPRPTEELACDCPGLVLPPPAGFQLEVIAMKHTASVRPNHTASVTIKTTQTARCLMAVDYPSGPSTAGGLVTKTADSSGVVTWTWKVGSHAPTGSWPIGIGCSLGHRNGMASTELRVK
jgi:hypothetical protein